MWKRGVPRKPTKVKPPEFVSRRMLDDLLGKFPPEQVAAEIAKMPQAHQDALAAGEARDSLAEFVRATWPIFDPDPLEWNWHMDVICQHLEMVARKAIPRLLINIPPRMGKSNLFAICWPAWCWTWDPKLRFLFLSYSKDLAVEHSIKCRQIVESDWYVRSFSGPAKWAIADDQNVKHDFLNTAGGRRQATSMTGQTTGHGGDIVAVDDPNDVAKTYSKAERDKVTRAMATVSQRLNDKREGGGAVAVIQQRLHEEDVSGYLLRAGGYEHLVMPMQFDPSRKFSTGRYVGVGAARARVPFCADPRREEGELLCPNRFPASALETSRRELGALMYAGQYQQIPAPAGGEMFLVANWRFWKPDGKAPDYEGLRPRGCFEGKARPLPKLDRVLISVDASFKETSSGSYVAMHVWGAAGADRFLLDRVHGRMDFSATIVALRSLCRRWPQARTKLIEEKANGAAIISSLKREISGLVPIEPEGGKESRAAASQPYQAAGNVYLPDNAPWLEAYIAEHAAFPVGQHDDDVDAQSQALRGFEQKDTTAAAWNRYAERVRGKDSIKRPDLEPPPSPEPPPLEPPPLEPPPMRAH